MGDVALGVLATCMTLLNGMARSRIRKIAPELRRPKRTDAKSELISSTVFVEETEPLMARKPIGKVAMEAAE
jgi:hypothetical protein